MVKITIAAVLVMLAVGCSTNDVKVSGMICPPGHTEEMVHSDFKECRAYDEKEADKATYPKQLDKECQECLIKRGYQIDQ